MSQMQQLITEHIDIWTAADTGKKSGRGRASGSAGSVYGIKKLRELILELAVRGKLVPQDANDEPASELLKRIQAEKAKLVAEGKFKKDKPLAAMTEDEKPFELPHGWSWTRLTEITTGMDSGWSPACLENSSPSNDVWGVLKTTSVQVMQYLECENKELPEKLVPRPEAEVKAGDILITRAGPTNRVAISCLVQSTRPRLMISDKIIRFHPIEIGIYGRFLTLCLNAGATAAFLEKAKSGMAASQVNISQEKLRLAPIPIPPLKLQHCIVAKVDELMALCDQLEAQHSNADCAHEQLVSHLLGTLTQSQDAGDFNTNWQRIATHFDTLFTTESSIDALKQTLLQLAVMGKLVPQDPKDEPASELLKRIQVEKARLVAEGKIKKDKPLAAIGEDEKKFEIPRNWEWCRIGFFASLISGKGFNASEYSNKGVRLFQIANVSLGYTKWEIENFLPVQYLDLHPDLVLEDGDVLVALNRPILNGLMKVCIISNEDLPAILYQRVGKFSFFGNTINTKYFYYFLQSGLFIDHLQEQLQGSDQPFINQSQLIKFNCSLPPRNEQNRIVAKVDELMTICKNLKSRITDARQNQQKLADVLVEQSLVA